MPRSNACTGACCVAFDLSGGLDSFEGLQSGKLQERHTEGMVRVKDILVPLPYAAWSSRLAQFGSTAIEIDPSAQKFTCNKFDEEHRLCTVYEQRPEMCRGYPYNRPCPHDGCTMGHEGLTPDQVDGVWAREEHLYWRSQRVIEELAEVWGYELGGEA